MKIAVRYTLAVMITVLVFLYGGGYNIIHYCCDGCRFGIAASVAESVGFSERHDCCNNHSGSESEAESSHCSSDGASDGAADSHSCNETANSDASKGCCIVEHISFDWEWQHTPKLISAPACVHLLLMDIALWERSLSISADEEAQALPQAPLRHPYPRGYLSLLTVLLI